MNYAEKLKQFNSTEKYKKELEFLKALILMSAKTDDTHLDFGCGIGTAVKYFNEDFIITKGYEKNIHNQEFDYENTYCEKYDTIYFLHSFAHIDNIQDVLIDLNTKRVIVITPNSVWLKLNHNPDYMPDPTVFKHYNQDELIKMFESLGFEIEISGGFGKVTDNQNERLFLVAKKK